MIAAGHDPAHLLRTYSWEQIGLLAECLSLHHTVVRDSILAPLVASMGHKYTPVILSSSAQEVRGRTSIDYDDPEMVERARARDEWLSAHFRVHDAP